MSQELEASRPISFSDIWNDKVAVILGIILGVFVVVVVVASFLICSSRKRNKKQQKDVEKMRGGGSIIVKSNSCQGGLNDSVDSLDCAGI